MQKSRFEKSYEVIIWKAIYQYVDTRLDDDEAKWKKELVNYQRSLPVTIKDFLDDYRSLLLQEFDMI